MCDYSLHATNNRLAVEGEELFVHRFYTGSKGMASKSDLAALRSWQPAPAGSSFWGKVFHHIGETVSLLSPGSQPEKGLPAVCIPPGARLSLSRYKLGFDSPVEVTFTQITSEPFRYRDAVRFDNGEVVLLQKLALGERAVVLSLAPAEIEEEQPVVKAPVRSFA